MKLSFNQVSPFPECKKEKRLNFQQIIMTLAPNKKPNAVSHPSIVAMSVHNINIYMSLFTFSLPKRSFD